MHQQMHPEPGAAEQHFWIHLKKDDINQDRIICPLLKPRATLCLHQFSVQV